MMESREYALVGESKVQHLLAPSHIAHTPRSLELTSAALNLFALICQIRLFYSIWLNVNCLVLAINST